MTLEERVHHSGAIGQFLEAVGQLAKGRVFRGGGGTEETCFNDYIYFDMHYI